MDRTRTPKGAWLIVALLFSFMLINFADKTVIGIAAVPIMQELKLSPSEFGLVGSSFYLLFALSAVVTGFVVNRVQTRWVLVAMGLVWALTQFPMMGAAGFGTLVACRIALGAGEGPAAPVALHSAYQWFPNELRTLPTAVILQGGAIGVMVALPLLNFIIVHYSWHWAFGYLASPVSSGPRRGWRLAARARSHRTPQPERCRHPSGSATGSWCSARRCWRAGARHSGPNGACRRRCPGRARF